MRRNRWTRFVLLMAVAGLVLVPAVASAESPRPLFTFADERITESSGLASASWSDDVFYTHNDSGDSARFFAVDRTGATVATYTLDGVRAVDWEDMARGRDDRGDPVLYLADIGDNRAGRDEIAVYRVPEPRGDSGSLPWIRYRFRYADGPRDAEALLIDPRTERLYIASKVLLGRGTMYAAPEKLSTTEVNVLQPIGTVPALVTAGDFSPSGEQVALLTYLAVHVGDTVTGPFRKLTGIRMRQAEGLTYSRDGRSLLVSSEGAHASVDEIRLEAEPSATPAAAPSPAPTNDPQPSVGQPQQLPLVAAGVAAGVVLVLTLWRLRRRNSHAD